MSAREQNWTPRPGLRQAPDFARELGDSYAAVARPPQLPDADELVVTITNTVAEIAPRPEGLGMTIEEARVIVKNGLAYDEHMYRAALDLVKVQGMGDE